MKNRVLRKLLNVVIAALILAAIVLVSDKTELFETSSGANLDFNLNLTTIINVLFVVAIMMLISNIIVAVLELFRNKKGRTGTLATVFISLVKYAAVLVTVCWVLKIIGVNVSTIFASVGILALILGFGAESLVADIVTGVFILFENQYNVGDIIEVDGFRGRVKEIGIRTISIEDAGSNIKIINNSDLKNIVNRSNQQSVAVCDVGIAYDLDLEELEKKIAPMLTDIKNRHSDVFIGRVEYAGVEALADSSVVLRFIADVKEENFFAGRRLLNKEIKIAFDKAGITIPYPQVDVHNK